MSDYHYKKVALGGTFDRLHKGHKALIHTAARLSKNISIGVTSDGFITNKPLAKQISPYPVRADAIRNFMDITFPEHTYEVSKLDDIYGPTLSDMEIDCLVITEDTIEGAEKINEERRRNNLSPLDTVICDLVLDQMNVTLSSLRIRKGLTDPNGIYFSRVFKDDITLTEDVKKILKEPLGELMDFETLKKSISLDTDRIIAVIGDVSLDNFLKNNLPFNYGVYDGKTQRKEKINLEFDSTTPWFETQNQSGTISHVAVDTIKKMLATSQAILKVDGEEDLLTLVMILLLPLDSLVVYGQPNQGIVAVTVTLENKSYWYHQLKNNHPTL